MPHQQRVAAAGNTGDIARWTSPLKMFEYLASGRALISSDLAVLREVLTDQNALLCKPDDLEQWREAILTLAGDERLRHRLGRQARQDGAGYSWRERARRILAVVNRNDSA